MLENESSSSLSKKRVRRPLFKKKNSAVTFVGDDNRGDKKLRMVQSESMVAMGVKVGGNSSPVKT